VGDQGISDIWLYLDAGQLVQQFGLRATEAEGAETPGLAESWRDRIGGSARDIWLAGLGALVAAGEQGERLFHTLVDQGRRLEESWRPGPTPAAETVEARPEGVTERARRIASTGQEYIRDVATSIRGHLDLPTRQELDELRRKIDELTARVEPSVGAGRETDVEH
jgi:poly(hydroxyalkanoate) granule-associated protein